MTRTFVLLLTLLTSSVLGALAQNQVSANDIFKQIDRKQVVAYEGVSIVGDLDLTELSNRQEKKNNGWNGQKAYETKVEVPLVFKNCTFRGNFIAYKVMKNEGNGRRRFLGFEVETNNGDLYTADFLENVVFENCTFEGENQFKYSDFGGKAVFAGSNFYKGGNFKYANFNGPASFNACQFGGMANFKYAEFEESADFQRNNFTAYADFKYSNFDEIVNFGGATFLAFADFKYTEFKREGRFDKTNFRAGSEFKYASGKRTR